MGGMEPNFDFLDGKKTPKNYSDYSSDDEVAFEAEKQRCEKENTEFSPALKRFLRLRDEFDKTPDFNQYNVTNPH